MCKMALFARIYDLPMLYRSPKNLLLILIACTAVALPSCAPLFSQGQNEPAPPPPEPIVYKDPVKAWAKAYRDTADIELSPKLKLSEKQKLTASQSPTVSGSGDKARYIYPEDVKPTKEQVQDGSALTPRQRGLMKSARLAARQANAHNALKAAEQYNKDNSEALAVQEKQGLHIVINLHKQSGVCKDGDKVLRKFRVCSGKHSTPTPQGHFHVLTKHEKHVSNIYHSSMPYFMRLTMHGVGLHQGAMRSRPSSHGCIRLTWNDARYLFKKCAVGTPVFITH